MTAHDLVVRGATVIDGTGAPGVEADVAVDGDRIVAVGDVPGSRRDRARRPRARARAGLDRHAHPSRREPVLGSVPHAVLALRRDHGRARQLRVRARADHDPRATRVRDRSARDGRAGAARRDRRGGAVRLDRPRELRRRARPGRDRAQPGVPRGPPPGARRGDGPGSGACTRVATAGRDRRDVPRSCPKGWQLGALGFSTDQVVGNIGPGNSALPGQVCDDEELLAVARALGAGPGPGLFTMAPRALLLDREQRRADLEWHEQLAAASGKPVVIGPVFDTYDEPGVGRDLLDAMGAAQARGHHVVGQVSPRPFELWTRLDAPGVLVRVLPTLSAAVKAGGADGVRHLADDPDAMDRLREEGARIRPSLIFSGRWDHVHVRYSPRSGDLRDRDVATIADGAGRGSDRRADRHRDRRRLRDPVRDRDAQPRRRRGSASSWRTRPRSSAAATPARTPRATPTAATRCGRCSTGYASAGCCHSRPRLRCSPAARPTCSASRDRGRIAAGRLRRPRALRPRPGRDRRRALRVRHARRRHPPRRRAGRDRGERRERDGRHPRRRAHRRPARHAAARRPDAGGECPALTSASAVDRDRELRGVAGGIVAGAGVDDEVQRLALGDLRSRIVGQLRGVVVREAHGAELLRAEIHEVGDAVAAGPVERRRSRCG